jgi:Holliday junction resolvase RusA-like endonuclease
MIKYTFVGTVPSKKNNRRWVQRGKRRYSIPSVAYERWEKAHKAALMAKFSVLHLTNYAVEIWFYMPNNVVRDTDNILTSILDCLKAAGIIADDRWQYMSRPPVMHQPEIDPENPRVEIVINHD